MNLDNICDDYVLSEKTEDKLKTTTMVITLVIYALIIAGFLFFTLPAFPVIIGAFIFGFVWKLIYPFLLKACLYLNNKGRYKRVIRKHPECTNLNFEAMNELYKQKLTKYHYLTMSERYEKGPVMADYRFITIVKQRKEAEAEKQRLEKEQLEEFLAKQKEEEAKTKEIEEARARVKENETLTNKAANQTISTYKATIELMTDEKLGKAKELAESLVEACNGNSLALDSCQRMFVAYIPEAIRILEEYRTNKVSEEMEETVNALVKKLEDTLESSLKRMQKDSDKYFKDNVSMLMETLDEEQFKNNVK